MSPEVDPSSTARTVFVTGGTGRGRTDLTAFDAALQSAGIHDANLIRVSSITPATAETKRPSPGELAQRIEPGAYYPAVYAHVESDTAGERIHAAVAGARLEAGYGINVEHHGSGADETEVRETCIAMLEEMAGRRNATITGDPWIRYESALVPNGDEWQSVVAAILYAQGGVRSQ